MGFLKKIFGSKNDTNADIHSKAHMDLETLLNSEFNCECKNYKGNFLSQLILQR